jgi:pyruvate formate lyase activating enzyme
LVLYYNTNMNKLKIFQKGWNYSQDGPGNRLVYHLQGCNMRCPWCSNPEGLSKDGTLMVDEGKLVDAVCPNGAIQNKKINRNVCLSCHIRECITKNKNLGIRFPCHEYTVESLVAEAQRARSLFYDGGGVTLTGGEATLQFEALKEFLTILKAGNINTALETNGTHPRLPELFPMIDTLIMDMKHYESGIHQQVIGIGNHVTIGNIQKAVREHADTWLRIPLIPGFNDGDEDARQFAGFFKQLPVRKVPIEVLAYHEFGKVKWSQCGLEYSFSTACLPKVRLKEFSDILRQYDLNLIHT